MCAKPQPEDLKAASSSLTWHAGWNVFQILWIYLTYLSGKKPTDSVWKGEGEPIVYQADQSDLLLLL